MSEQASVGAATARTDVAALTEFANRRRGPLRRYLIMHPRVTDAVVLLCYLLLSVPNAIYYLAVHGDPWPVALCLVCGAVLAARRVAPVAVLAVVAVVEPLALVWEPDSSTVGAGVWFGLYAVAVARTPRTAAVSVIVATVPQAVAFAVYMTPPFSWVVVALGLVTNVIAAGIGSMVRRDRLHASELIARAADNAKLAQITERNRIAREMHDVVAHSLSVMIALSDGAGVVLKRDPARASEVLSELSKTGRGALADMRRVLGVLRRDGGEGPDTGRSPTPADSDLHSMLEGFRLAGLPLRLIVAGPALPADPALTLAVYRIVQESLTNVLRYGRGVSDVEVSLERERESIHIRVIDNGQATPGESVGAGQGLVGMAERAAIYDGTVDCGPGAHGGWVVDAWLSWPYEREGTGG